MLQEERRRAVEERMARKLRLADETDQLEVHQRLDVRRNVHAADLLDLALGDRLAVGDDGERLEGRAAEAARTVELEHRTHVASAARDRLQAVRAARADELEAAARDVKRLLKALQRLVDLAVRARAVDVHHLGVLALLGLDGLHRLAQFAGRKRRLAREEKRSDDFLQAARQRDLHLVTHSLRVSPGACLPAPPSRAES